MATGLVVMTNDAEINTGNLMHNFYYLQEYLSAISVNATLIQGVALNSDFRDAVASALAQDLDSFIPNLATAIYGISEFVERVVTAQAGVDGETFNGLAYNDAFIESLVVAMVDTEAFINAFMNYFDENASALYTALKSDVFRAYYGPDIADFPFGTAETGDVGAISLLEYPEPDVVGEDATKYIGVTFGLGDDFSDVNIFVSKDDSFPLSTLNPGPTGTMRFTPLGSPVGSATGYIHGAYFDPNSGAQLLDISDLEWSGEEPLYVKFLGTKTGITLIRVGFDYAKHAAQTNSPASINDPSAIEGVDLKVNSQTDWERFAGADGAPQVSDYYSISSGKIEIPDGLRVVIDEVDGGDYGITGAGYTWNRLRAYTMYNPIYLKGNLTLEANGLVTIVKRNTEATFRVEPKNSFANCYNSYGGGTERRIYVVFDEGEIIEGDMVYYPGPDQYYYVMGVNPTSNYIDVDRDISTNYSVQTLSVLYQNVKMSGFYFDGRGGLLDYNDTPLKTETDGGGGFGNFEGLANSIFDIIIVNCKALNGGAFYLDKCINIQVRRPIRLCQAEEDVYSADGEGGAIYGGVGVKAEATMCSAYTGGGFSKCVFSTIKGYKNIAETPYTENFYQCSFSKEIHHNNFDSLKIVARTKVNTAGSLNSLTTLLTVSPGVKLVIADFFIIVTASSSVTTAASISIGNNDPDYDNLFAAANIQLKALADKKTYQPERSFGTMAIFGGGDEVKCRLDTPIVGTSQTIEIVLCGYEYQDI